MPRRCSAAWAARCWRRCCAAVEKEVVELHAQAAADAAEMRTALRAVVDAVPRWRQGWVVTSRPHAVAAAAGGHVNVGGGSGSGGERLVGVGTLLEALLLAVLCRC